MNNNNPTGTKTRWGEVIEVSCNVCYPLHIFDWAVSLDKLEIPDLEFTFVFVDKNYTRRRVVYEAKRVNKSVSAKQFLKNMRKPTDILFEDFPEKVIIDDVIFKICSIGQA